MFGCSGITKFLRQGRHFPCSCGARGHLDACPNPFPVCVSLQILNVSAVVLANLCVSHIMTSNNAQVSCWDGYRASLRAPVWSLLSLLFFPHAILMVQAEELMKKIEKEEEQISNDDPNKKVFHHCIVNLVIG